MSLDARLSRVMPALNAKERAILVLRSLKDRTPEDPAWRSTMQREQTSEFNRLIGLMNACNIFLPLYITMVEQRTEQLYLRRLWLDTTTALGLQAWRLAELLPAGKRKRAEKVRGDYWPVVELPWHPEDDPSSWLNVCDRGEAALRSGVVSQWQMLRAVDVVLDEVATEFEGEDPLRPVMRGIVEATRRKLKDLHEVLNAAEPLKLEEPDEETLALARTYFENGRRLMSGLTG